MGKYTERSKLWEWKNSIYLLFCFSYLLAFVPFFIMGHKAHCSKWTKYGILYMVLIFSLFFTENEFIVAISLVSCVVAVIHTFLARREYMVRLDVEEDNGVRESRNAELKQKIYEENSTKNTSNASVASTPATKSAPTEKKLASHNEYIRKIDQLNNAIADPVVSPFLDNIKLTCIKIIEYVEQHPEKENATKSFMNYYLPEFLKLTETYSQMSMQPIKGPNIINSMQQIEGMLSTILQAFMKLYDDLYGDSLNNVSTDIKVLRDELALNGLTFEDKPF